MRPARIEGRGSGAIFCDLGYKMEEMGFRAVGFSSCVPRK